MSVITVLYVLANIAYVSQLAPRPEVYIDLTVYALSLLGSQGKIF